MNTTQLADAFWEQGYLVLEGFFSKPLMDATNEKIQAHFGANPDFWHNDEFLKESKTEVIPWFPRDEKVEVFELIELDERFAKLTNAVLGEAWQDLYCMVMFSKTGTVGQAWHQDCHSDDDTQFNINRLIYTADIVPEIGGEVVVVPGSHRLGEIPIGDPHGHFENEVVLRPTKGTLVLLHGRTFHKVLPTKGGARSSTNYRAVPKSSSLGITDTCVYRNMKYSFIENRVVEERVPQAQ